MLQELLESIEGKLMGVTLGDEYCSPQELETMIYNSIKSVLEGEGRDVDLSI